MDFLRKTKTNWKQTLRLSKNTSNGVYNVLKTDQGFYNCLLKGCMLVKLFSFYQVNNNQHVAIIFMIKNQKGHV